MRQKCILPQKSARQLVSMAAWKATCRRMRVSSSPAARPARSPARSSARTCHVTNSYNLPPCGRMMAGITFVSHVQGNTTKGHEATRLVTINQSVLADAEGSPRYRAATSGSSSRPSRSRVRAPAGRVPHPTGPLTRNGPPPGSHRKRILRLLSLTNRKINSSAGQVQQPHETLSMSARVIKSVVHQRTGYGLSCSQCLIP